MIYNQNICFLFIYVNLLFHINFLWIMWITLCITQISRFFNLSKMWITFTPFFALSTFFPIIRHALCNLLFVRFYSTFFYKTKELQFCKLPKTIALYCLTTQTIYREGIFVPKPPRSPRLRLQLRPGGDFWYVYHLLQRFPVHW